MLTHIHPVTRWFASEGGFVVHRPYNVRLLLEPPRAQSPFARSRCDLARRGLTVHVSRRYPAFVAPTGSRVSPPPSSHLGRTLSTRSMPVAVSPCGEKDLPDVALPICPCVLGPLPRQLAWCIDPFLPTRQRPSPRSDRVGAQQYSVQRLQYGALFRGCSPSRMFRPTGVLTTPVAPPATAHVRRAAVVFPSEPLVGCYLPTPRICSSSESGN